MSRSTFLKLHKKNNLQEYDEDHTGKSEVFNERSYKDLSSFREDIANEALFRLRILRQISRDCEQINIKTIEPLRVKLQRKFQRDIPSTITIYRWWLAYRKADYNIVSLAPKINKRGNRTVKVPKVVSAFMVQAINDVISAKQINIQSAFRRVRRKIRQYNLVHGTHYKYPNYESIRKRVKKLTPFEKIAARKGERAAKREFRRMGKRILTSNVLERVEIDHTWLDLFAVDNDSRVTIGRPYLTQLVDCYSKAVIGFYLGFEPPSYISVSLALKNAIQRKEKLLAHYPSIKNEWICYGIPDLIVTDNAKEFLSENFGRACESLLIILHQNKVETPDNKPHVERQYGTTNTSLLNDLPGKAFSNYLQREGYDSIGEATLTLDEIKEIYLLWLVDIYHKKPNKRGTNCPNVTWRQGAKEWAPDEFEGTSEELDFHFAILDQKVLTDIGITLCKELDYSSDRLAEYRGKKGNHKVKFKYNPEHMGFIWVLDEDQEEYFKVPAIEYEYASTVSLWQHKINLEIKEKLNNSDYNEAEEIDTEIAIEEIVHESIRKKKTSITNKKRAARYLENSERAKSQKNNDIVLDEKKSPSSIETDVDDDSDWDIDYV